MSNRMVKLARRPKGMVTREDFAIEDGPVPEPGAGEFRVGVRVHLARSRHARLDEREPAPTCRRLRSAR